MLIDVTYSCKMGCPHCMSDCKPDGEHMSIEVFNDALEFMIKNKIPGWTFTGGEMFEHPEILKILDIISKKIESKEYTGPILFITNGRELARNIEVYEAVYDFQRKRKKSLTLIQVTEDPRFYHDSLTDKDLFRLKKLGVMVDPVPGSLENPKKCLYPQGRALENYTEEWFNTIGPKCANCVLVAKQKAKTFTQLVYTLLSINKFCTPAIAPDGSIKLGESALCPSVASIYDKDSVIMEKIRNHKCRACKIAWERLQETNPKAYELLK